MPAKSKKRFVSQKAVTKLSEHDTTTATVHILGTNNDIIITATDASGAETIASYSGGMCVKACRDEATPYAAQMAMMKTCHRLKELGIKDINVQLRSKGGYYQSGLKQCTTAALKVLAKEMVLQKLHFIDVTPVAHGYGCRIS